MCVFDFGKRPAFASAIQCLYLTLRKNVRISRTQHRWNAPFSQKITHFSYLRTRNSIPRALCVRKRDDCVRKEWPKIRATHTAETEVLWTSSRPLSNWYVCCSCTTTTHDKSSRSPSAIRTFLIQKTRSAEHHPKIRENREKVTNFIHKCVIFSEWRAFFFTENVKIPTREESGISSINNNETKRVRSPNTISECNGVGAKWWGRVSVGVNQIPWQWNCEEDLVLKK